MVDLNKRRIAVYTYFSIVFSLIFGLSFTVEGNKITGSFILETTSNFIDNMNLFSLVLIVFVFLLFLSLSFFVIRYVQETRNNMPPKKVKSIAKIVTVLLVISFLSFGFYFGSGKEKITGYAVNDELTKKYKNIKDDYIKESGGTPNDWKIDTESRFVCVNPAGCSLAIEEGVYYSEGGTFPPPGGFYEGKEGAKDELSENLKAIEELQLQKLAENLAYKATWQLLDLTLGSFAFGYVDDYCSEQWDSSDYAGGTSPLTYTSNSQHLVSGGSIFQPTTNNCIGTETTVTAQAQKSILATGFTYQTSWTITPCKENIQYNIYLANSIDDRIGIATGIANKGITKSEARLFSYAKNYNFICVQVSDGSIGTDGYACFNVV